MLRSSIGLYVKIGDYPDHKAYGINQRYCGLRYVVTTINITYSTKCFRNTYPTKTFEQFVKPYDTIPSNGQVISRVAKGVDAELGEAPWSLLLKRKKAVTYCSGVLITWQWVLTTAHCFDTVTEFMTVVAGNQRGHGVIRYESLTFIHPLYAKRLIPNAESLHDLALVQLKKPFKQLNKEVHMLINPICLPNTGQFNKQQEMATLYGWGKRFISKDTTTEWLQKGHFIIEPYFNCPRQADGVQGIMCGHNLLKLNTSLGCQGDEGAGLVQYTQAKQSQAILIATVRSGEKKVPGDNCWTKHTEFISTSVNMQWILHTIKDNTVIH